MKTSYWTFIRINMPLGILIVILLIVTTLLAHHRQAIPLSAETTTFASVPDCNSPVRSAEQVNPTPAIQQPARLIPTTL
jgi:hypothetical protein